MAVSVAGALRPLTGFEIAKIPLGKAVVLAGGMGVGDFLKALTHRLSGGRLPQWATGLAVAWALQNVKQLRDLVGPDTAELVSLVIVADTLNDQLDIQRRTANLLASFMPGRLGVVSNSPPVLMPGRGRQVTRPFTANARSSLYSSLGPS